jgi:uncharacterized protein (DUF488 family)
MIEPAILTVGHSNHPIEHFLRLVKNAGVGMVVDVRSFPVSCYAPQFNKEALPKSLDGEGIAYLYLGKELVGRPHERPTIPKDFQKGIDRVTEESLHRRIAMMCAERDPLDCHRCLLVARCLAERGVDVGHILASGDIASHRETEDRLLVAEGLAAEDFFSREQRLADAYNARSGHRAPARAALE